jgi:hypothetical protein
MSGVKVRGVQMYQFYANPEHFTVTLFLPAEPEDVKGVMYSCF